MPSIKKPERRHEPPPLDNLEFTALMNEHFHATEQCLCDIVIALEEVMGDGRMSAALNARINDSTTDRTAKSDALLAVVFQAASRHAERNRRSRT